MYNLDTFQASCKLHSVMLISVSVLALAAVTMFEKVFYYCYTLLNQLASAVFKKNT